MRIKTFYTKTMSEALQKIRTHLGPDALLLSTKEVPRRSGVWGTSSGFEVVAAVDDSEKVDSFMHADAAASVARERKWTPAVSAMNPGRRPAKSFLDEVTLDAYFPAEEIHAGPIPGMAAAKTTIRCGDDVDGEIAFDTSLPFTERVPVALYIDLINCGVDSSLACELLVTALDSLPAEERLSRKNLVRSVTQAALAMVADPSTLNGMPAKRVVAFFGPTGVGKTTSIAKLAARLALQQKKKVVLMTTDGYRIGAIEQLRSYAGLMGIPFRFVDQVAELPKAIEENTQRDYILIDTAGHGPRDLESMRALASFLKESEFIERHLVLSAATKSSDMRETMDRFEMCCPDHLLFTKLDETSTPGPILNELVRTQKSFSYYSNGQRVPDDLHVVPRDRIIDIVLKQNENAL